MRAERDNPVSSNRKAELTIGEVATRAGVRASAVRYYESAGLLPTPRRVSGRRVYEPAVLDRLAAIRLARRAGFTIGEVQALVGDGSEDTSPRARWGPLAQRKLGAIRRAMQDLERQRRVVERVAVCECATLEECGRVTLSDEACANR